MTRDAQVVVRTDRFDADLAALLGTHGFRIDAISPADAPTTAVVSAHGVRLRLEAAPVSAPVTLQLFGDDGAPGVATLPGGSTIELRRRLATFELPAAVPSLTITHDSGAAAAGRAGMRYRDLLPDRWGGAFVASQITIPEGGPVPDYVHFHKVRFQMIFVVAGWVRVVYEDQGEPFVMRAGDCVLQPPEIRHRVLEASPGLKVIEVGCPAVHETIADWSLTLPNGIGDPGRSWHGSRFVRHVAERAAEVPWRFPGWHGRDTGIATATDGLAGVQCARPSCRDRPPGGHDTEMAAFDTEFALVVVVRGEVTFETDDTSARLRAGSSVAVPGGVAHRFVAASPDCELLDVTLPAGPCRA